MQQFLYSPPTEPLKIIYEDRDFVVVDKPSGLLSVPGRVHRDSVLERLSKRYKHVYAVHRLDMDTSGILVVAIRRKSEKELQRQFREKEVKKIYIAVVEGLVSSGKGSISSPLLRIGGLPPRSVIDSEKGKSALTEYAVEDHLLSRTRLKLFPKTGRSHQLRVHLASIGHPIVGDRIYHPSPNSDSRLLLHAQKLTIRHPYSGERHVFSSDPEGKLFYSTLD